MPAQHRIYTQNNMSMVFVIFGGDNAQCMFLQIDPPLPLDLGNNDLAIVYVRYFDSHV